MTRRPGRPSVYHGKTQMISASVSERAWRRMREMDARLPFYGRSNIVERAIHELYESLERGSWTHQPPKKEPR